MSHLPHVRLRAAVLGCLAALLGAPALAPAQQRPPEPVLPGDAASVKGETRLPRLARLLPQYLADKDWDSLAHALQVLLDLPGALLPERLQDASGRPYVRWYSPHTLASGVVRKLPPEARKVYEDFYGPVARQLLARARAQNDLPALAAVAQRYFHTEAGPEALALLAERQSESGQHLPAALCYRRLLGRPGANPPGLTLYRAALAFRKVGDTKGAARAWKRLEGNVGKDGLDVGGEKLTLDQLKQRLEGVKPLTGAGAAGWPVFRGDAARSGRAAGGPPDLGKPLWQRPTVMDRSDETGEVEQGKEAKQEIDRIFQARLRLSEPSLPGFFPLAAGELVVYRSYLGLTAVLLSEVKDKDGKVEGKPGEIEWKSTYLEGSLGLLFANPPSRQHLQGWLRTYEKFNLGHLLYENPSVGTLACDDRFVYAVDELGLPPPAPLPLAGQKKLPRDLAARVRSNNLDAFELATGKIAWRLGDRERKDDPFSGGSWLGPPLPLGGTIYALHEKAGGAVSLVCVEPAKRKVLASGPLARVQDPYATTLARRLHPAHLAYGGGVLVCPTHAGAVVGVDLATQTPVWAYTYREGRVPPPPPPRFRKPAPPPAPPQQGWRNSAPVIVGDKVVFTAADEDSVHCLNVRDGSLVWRKGKEGDDLYLAGVYAGKVLLVGKASCRALDLASGKEVWRVETGVPSGMGVAAGDTYYLPLLNRAGAQGPAVGVLDLEKGQVVRFLPAGKTAPGNLLFYRGQLISQGPATIAAYPVRKAGQKERVP
jgi:hypothetical protein